MLNCLIVGAGGFLGAVTRYLIGLLPLGTETAFPVKTFFINIIGSFLIGLVVAWSTKSSSLSPQTVLFLKVGICGGFTTFSSFALETQTLLRDGRLAPALLYAVGSVVLGILAVYAAEMLVK